MDTTKKLNRGVCYLTLRDFLNRGMSHAYERNRRGKRLDQKKIQIWYLQVILVNKNCLRLLLWIYLYRLLLIYTDYLLCVFWWDIRADFVFKTFEHLSHWKLPISLPGFPLSPPACICFVETVALSSNNMGVAIVGHMVWPGKGLLTNYTEKIGRSKQWKLL